MTLSKAIILLACLRFSVPLDRKTTCAEQTANCTNLQSIPLHRGPLIQTHRFSQLIRLRPRNIPPLTALRADDAFLDHVALLYNNENQLRALLTLLSSDTASPWLATLNTYDDCNKRSGRVYTCVEGNCTEHDLKRLQYMPSIFAEDVLGFEISSPRFQLSVLVAVRNRATKTSRAVRVPINNVSVFDALFNSVKHFFVTNGMRDAPILKYMNAYRQVLTLLPGNRSPPNVLRRHSEWL